MCMCDRYALLMFTLSFASSCGPNIPYLPLDFRFFDQRRGRSVDFFQRHRRGHDHPCCGRRWHLCGKSRRHDGLLTDPRQKQELDTAIRAAHFMFPFFHKLLSRRQRGIATTYCAGGALTFKSWGTPRARFRFTCISRYRLYDSVVILYR